MCTMANSESIHHLRFRFQKQVDGCGLVPVDTAPLAQLLDLLAWLLGTSTASGPSPGASEAGWFATSYLINAKIGGSYGGQRQGCQIAGTENGEYMKTCVGAHKRSSPWKIAASPCMPPSRISLCAFFEPSRQTWIAESALMWRDRWGGLRSGADGSDAGG